MKMYYLSLLVLIFTVLGCTHTARQSSQSDEWRPDSQQLEKLMSEKDYHCSIQLGNKFFIDIAEKGQHRHFPFAYKFGDNIFVSYSEHDDIIVASPVDALSISRDNGKTWGEKIVNSDFYFTSMFEKDGVLYGITYMTYPISSTQEESVYWTSNDAGRSWSQHYGVVNTSEDLPFTKNGPENGGIWGSMEFHRGMEVMEDGSVQGVMYGTFGEGADLRASVAWVKSEDNCKTWDIVSVVASGTPPGFEDTEGYCEPTFAKVKDGTLLCVMRIDGYAPLFQSRSKDGGKTWSEPTQLPGLSPETSYSVDPHLLLTSDKVLLLSYGRPGNKLAFSRDGSGYNWDEYCVTRKEITTGYTGIVEINPGKILLIGDHGNIHYRKVQSADTIAVYGQVIKFK